MNEADFRALGQLLEGLGLGFALSDAQGRPLVTNRLHRGAPAAASFCSISTARALLRNVDPDHITYVLAKCRTHEAAKQIVAELRNEYPDISAFTSEEFSLKSQLHWLFKTKAGIALGYAAVLGLLVGAVVTSQTLYAATAASMFSTPSVSKSRSPTCMPSGGGSRICRGS